MAGGGGSNNQLVVQGTPPGPLTAQNLAPTVGAITGPLPPTLVNTTVPVNASFTNLDGNSQTAVWNWGDGGTSAGTVSQNGTTGTVSASHVYAAVGIYTITLTVADSKGGGAGTSIFTLTVLTRGVTQLSGQVYIVGGNTTNDVVQVNPVGSSATGSTGVQVKRSLNGVATATTVNQPVTALVIYAFSGNDAIQLAPSLTVSAAISAGNGNDAVQAGGGTITVTLGNGNDTVRLGNGNNTVMLGNGNDTVLLGNGNNVVVTGNGNNTIQAGKGDNLIAAGLGQHTVQVGNGSNILIDGTVALTQSGDSLGQVLSDWISNGATASNVASIRARLHVTYNNSHANTLLAGSGLDWFWETYAKDTTNRKPGDLLN